MKRILLCVLSFMCCHLFAEFPQAILDKTYALGEPLSSQVLVISVSEQKMYLYEQMNLKASYIISTAKKGIGQKQNSFQTPIGLHKVYKKIGNGAKPGTIFRARLSTGKVWPKGNLSQEDLVLTRILWLEGLEPGLNQGKNSRGEVVDSKKRLIYIHGTNQEQFLGQPASHGCVRMETEDILGLYNKINTGALVWIQE